MERDERRSQVDLDLIKRSSLFIWKILVFEIFYFQFLRFLEFLFATKAFKKQRWYHRIITQENFSQNTSHKHTYISR